MRPTGWRAGFAGLAVLAASACAGEAARRESAAPSAYSAIAMQTASWGKPVSEWRIDRTGTGTYSSARDVPGGGFRDYDVVTRRFSAGPDAFRRIEALLAPAERGYECTHQVTDGLYGDVRWERAGAQPLRRNFNYGCLSADAERAYSGMWQAGELVEAWAQAGELVGTQQVREPRP